MSVGPPPGDQARATVLVEVAPDEAFRIFTQEIDQWWRRGSKYRVAGQRRGIIHLEPKLGGRLFESFDIAQGSKVIETGKVTAFDPPSRIVFEWRAVNFSKAETTEVEVQFEPSRSGTQVTVTHRGWSRIRADHPARHGQSTERFIGSTAMWWGSQLASLRERADGFGS